MSIAAGHWSLRYAWTVLALVTCLAWLILIRSPPLWQPASCSVVSFGKPPRGPRPVVGHYLRNKQPGILQQLLRAAELFVEPDLDAVITYVNGSESSFKKSLERELQTHCGMQQGSNNNGGILPNAATENRFRDHDDLKMLLRSLAENGNVFRFIHLVVVDEQQVPQWLDRTNERIKIVFHKDIWRDPSQSHVFNSLAIEANLHHIPGLSEAFVYFNDDVLLLQNATKHDFIFWNRITGTVNTVMAYSGMQLPENYHNVGSADAHWLGPAVVTRNLLNQVCPTATKHLKQSFGYTPMHAPHVFLRSVLYHAESSTSLSTAFHATSHAKFRSGKEINTAMLFTGYAQCVRGYSILWQRSSQAVYVGVSASVDKSDAEHQEEAMRMLLMRSTASSVKYACLNDVTELGAETDTGRKSAENVYGMRQSLFPRRSSFEVAD